MIIAQNRALPLILTHKQARGQRQSLILLMVRQLTASYLMIMTRKQGKELRIPLIIVTVKHFALLLTTARRQGKR